MPLPYYRRLNRAKQALYRRSVALPLPKLKTSADLRARTAAVEVALLQATPKRTRNAAQGLLDEICTELEVPRVQLKVKARRPGDETSELQGLYEREEDETPIITVWMRTNAKAELVKFRTFMRTLLHELVHHLDYDYYDLEDSLHTEGFFKRESALFRALVPSKAKRRTKKKSTSKTSKTESPEKKPSRKRRARAATPVRRKSAKTASKKTAKLTPVRKLPPLRAATRRRPKKVKLSKKHTEGRQSVQLSLFDLSTKVAD